MSETLSGKHVSLPDTSTEAALDVGAGPMTAAPSAEAAPVVPLAGAPAERRQLITCPACKKTREVALNRRSSADFCSDDCDYPLFWTPESILLSSEETSTDSGRRRPGTGGLDTFARDCPYPDCRERNALDAVHCTACGRELDPRPTPVTVVVPRPAPVVVPPEPEPAGTPLWVWIAVGLTTVLALALILWAALG